MSNLTRLRQLDFGVEPYRGPGDISWVCSLINLQTLCLEFGKVHVQATKQFSLLIYL